MRARPTQVPTVFLDTTALKFAAERVIRGNLRSSTVSWGDREFTVNVTQFVEVFPNTKLDRRMQAELRPLPFLAYLARCGKIKLTTQTEVWWEFHGLPKTDDPDGVFYGAPVDRCPDPFPYGRTMAGHIGPRPADHQFEFVRHLGHTRFAELKIAVGATPAARNFKNQLLDAFHLLSAESAGCDYFLTLDFKLLRHLANHKRYPPRVSAVAPRGLVHKLFLTGHLGLADTLKYLRYAINRRNSLPDHPLQSLVDLGKKLEAKGYFDE